MQLDRILVAILEWLNTLVWYHQGTVPSNRKPYERIRSWRLAGRGILHQVHRSQEICPRAVGTMIFQPFRYDQRGVRAEDVRNIHLCCDYLEGMFGAAGTLTHRITILEANHWPRQDGRYEAKEVYQADYDFQGQQGYRDRYVPCILLGLGRLLYRWRDLDWPGAVDAVGSNCLGSTWSGKFRPPDFEQVAKYSAIAHPWDPDTRRIGISNL